MSVDGEAEVEAGTTTCVDEKVEVEAGTTTCVNGEAAITSALLLCNVGMPWMALSNASLQKQREGTSNQNWMLNNQC
jgi:hypothetical protein